MGFNRGSLQDAIDPHRKRYSAKTDSNTDSDTHAGTGFACSSCKRRNQEQYRADGPLG